MCDNRYKGRSLDVINIQTIIRCYTIWLPEKSGGGRERIQSHNHTMTLYSLYPGEPQALKNVSCGYDLNADPPALGPQRQSQKKAFA